MVKQKQEVKTNAMRILDGLGISYTTQSYECKELDFKKAAKSVGEKSVVMIHVKDIKEVTGYVRGGCTSIGMKKNYPVRIDSSAESIPDMYVSAGKIGCQINLNPGDLKKAANAEWADIVRSE